MGFLSKAGNHCLIPVVEYTSYAQVCWMPTMRIEYPNLSDLTCIFLKKCAKIKK